MYDEIVVPVDGSSFGELALPVALGIACRSGGEVRLVTVVTPLTGTQPKEGGDLAEEERLALATQAAEGYQAELQKRVILSGCDVPISTHVEVGTVVEGLDQHVRDAGGDLLVMTTHGRGPLRRSWLGSVADGLLRRTPCPILVIRPQEGEEVRLEEAQFQHILCTLDGSGESREILPHAQGLAKICGARITLLRVIPLQFPLTSSLTSHGTRDSLGVEEQAAVALETLESEAASLRESGLDVDVEVLSGVHPPDGIIDFARRASVDLVAMATHGRGGVARLILGSVADKVVRGGSFPVLLHRMR
jgi:nucleotide-binding universal stress UspA family protein